MIPIGVNAAVSIASKALGVRLDPYVGHNFLVEVAGLVVGGFREVTGLSSSIDLHEYEEGGVNGYLHKIPGKTRYENLVLSRGMTELDTLYGWYDDVCHGVIKRRDISIMLLDQRRIPVMWWTIHSAIPVKWNGPSFDATRDAEVAVETIELVHKGISKPIGSRITAAGRAGLELVGQLLPR